MLIYFDEEEQVSEELLRKMNEAAETCLAEEGVDPGSCELSVSFVSEEEIHDLNREHRGVDRKTDVLSFPQFEDLDDIEEGLGMFGEISLGDVVICRDVCAEQAKEYGHSYERELIYLFVHSILHLLGYDHEEPEEKAEMRKREEAVMDKIGLPR